MNNTQKNSIRTTVAIIVLCALILLLAAGNLLIGSVDIPTSEIMSILAGNGASNPVMEIIILESRIPTIITALLGGAALAVCGLLLQTVFNNPLADPSILGVSTGASLGVAIVMLLGGGLLGSAFDSELSGYISTLAGAFAGAMAVLAMLLIFSTFVKSETMLLIIGIMVSYLTSSAISLLNFFASEEGVHSYVVWGMGNFSSVTTDQLISFSVIVVIGLAAALLMVKPLNALLLGTKYAENLGLEAMHRPQSSFSIH